MVVCYAQVILVCVYAGILSIQPSNYSTPATSVIVFIALLPVSIDDRPLRMYIVMLCETAAYLTVSYFLKSSQAFSLDIMNGLTFCVVGMVVYGIICARNVREIHQSVRVERIQRGIISSLATVVEERDDNTGDHIRRTGNYVSDLLTRMKKLPEYASLSKEYCDNVVMAAPMHDIGKIKIPDAILNKPGKLTPEEYEIIKKHAEYVGEIIRKTVSDLEEKDYCDIAYNIARHHHEYYDGSGYPDGLRGDAIPEVARIIAVADAYDAMTSHRSYRDTLPQDEVRAELKRCSGTQFDPVFADIMIGIMDEDKDYQLREQ
ncbi:MAG: HD domain-containing protein [Lachnospiraceae bacterium]|nr:HD domain-containing protein [Lachnospiraceae bacterium]